MSKRVQLTLFECTAKRTRGDSESSSTIPTSSSACLGTASVTTQLATQLESATPSFQVCEISEYNDASIMSDPEPSAWSIAADSPVYSCPTPPFNNSSDEEPILQVAKFSDSEPDSSQHSFLIVHDTIPSPPPASIPSTTIGISSTLTITSIPSTTGTVVAKPNTLPGRSTDTTVEVASVPNDIAQTVAFPPVRPVNVKFPATKFGSTTRTFNVAWYDKFNWLEYSVERNACYCYPCRIFGASSSYGRSRPESAFTTTGFRNWKKATGKDGVLNRHASSVAHKQAEIAWHQYKCNSEQGTSISDRLSSARSVTITQNRHYLISILKILLVCGKQDIALRGHREGSDSSNRGNFLELLHLVGTHDSVVQQRLDSGPRNATYTSPEIQNLLLHLLASTVRENITLAAKKSGMYSILADETKDSSKEEQLSIVIRYVDVDTAEQNERFLTYVKASSLNAEGLSSYILTALHDNGLDPSGIVSQGYDGASVMSGHCSGVQQRIKAVAPMAVYIHCYAHCLNLVLVDSTKSLSVAAEFFALLEALYVFMSASKANTVYTEKQSILYPEKPARRLQRLSDTRWACRYDAVDAICSTFDAVVAALQSIMDGDDKAKAIEAKGIFLQIYNFKFLMTLIIFWRFLFCTKQLSDHLQSTKMDMCKAADLVGGTLETLQCFRSDEEWAKIYKYVNDVADLHKISATPMRSQHQRRTPSRLDDCIIMETTGNRSMSTSGEDYKVSLYFPVLDAMIQEF